MRPRLAISLTLIGGMSASLAVAQAGDDLTLGDPTDYVDARQGVMWSMQIAAGLIIDESAAEEPVLDHLIEAAEILSGNLQAVPLLFPEGSDKAATPGVLNHASDRVWQDTDGFNAAARTAIDAADALQAAGDMPAMMAAFERLETACSDCHASYLDYDPFEAIANDPPPERDAVKD